VQDIAPWTYAQISFTFGLKGFRNYNTPIMPDQDAQNLIKGNDTEVFTAQIAP